MLGKIESAPTTATPWSTSTPGWRRRTTPTRMAYLKAENAYTEARTAHLAALREASSARSRPGPRRPTCRCRAQGRLLVLRPHGRGPAVRHPLPRAPSPTARPRRRSSRRRQPAARRGDPARRQRRGRGDSRVLRPRHASTSARTGGCSPTRSTSPATSGSRCRCKDLAPASPARRGARTFYGSAWSRDGSTLFYLRRRRLAAAPGVAAPRRHARRRTTSGLRGARRAVLGRRRPDPLARSTSSSTCTAR